ncbi:hypothetical protein QE428_002902 [Microbacterium sp. SORGH_AS 505]|uniref:hypothetical protein n=1 Tax=Microbacterium sp. SORGH_AS_0505 TaxID=3041770 RepID=UPI00278146D9|nr:hypothetical protein [Microbacterium sp. SORGH_AS_0505]MDQ1127869.1 hypothetical protein [Microbacterium sp. SORGH_AS_0505]
MARRAWAWSTVAIVAASLALVASITGGIGWLSIEAPDAFLFVAGGVAPAAIGVALAVVAHLGGLVGARSTGALLVAAVVAGTAGGLAAAAVRASSRRSDDGLPTATVDALAVGLAAVGVVALAVFLAVAGSALLRRAGLPVWASATLGVIGGAIVAPVLGVIAVTVHLLTAVGAVALIGCAVEMRRRMPVVAV